MRTLLALAFAFALSIVPTLYAGEPACFELRTYHAAEANSKPSSRASAIIPLRFSRSTA